MRSDLEAYLASYADPRWLTIGPGVNGDTHPDSVRTYLGDGRGVAWAPPNPDGLTLAVDAELASQRVSPRLARCARSDDPAVVWPRWTACEAAAKVLDLPVLSWLHWPSLEVPAAIAERVVLRHVEFDGIQLCFGVRAD
ncbi:hypothetical protein G9U51_02210 [Calidifontibacter sp. DB0510]|uniref:Uncharacterized protein n=1 Tax=Metallococcus carri TaxID=1656884 RepID=A0A967AXL2_9MICO|nr:hypothetical protein [Metallococcus carri]NHN54593.1 hypothetical protein [Metallococcus carri]NOP36568.1 hypothetical protein [Calidifontibacter sp. DB2511S]